MSYAIIEYLVYLLIVLAVLYVGIFNFLSGKNFLRDILHYFQVSLKSLEYWDSYCSNNKNRSDIIISFTTIPSRIKEITPTIKSLLSQNIAPKKIHLYVPEVSMRENTGYEIPEEFTNLKCFNVIRVEHDWGPSTKFIPALGDLDQNQRILVVDDDNMYPKTILESFDEASNNYPECILASSGWRVPTDLVDRDTTLWTNLTRQAPVPVPTTKVSENYPIDIVQGYSGFLVRPKFFDYNELTNYPDEPKALRYVDDVWVSAHAKVSKFVFPSGRFCYSPFWKKELFRSNSLSAINNHGKERDEDRNNSIAIKYFKGRWLNA